MTPKLQRFTDGLYVIVGAHLTLNEAQEQFGEEYDEEVDAFDDNIGKPITSTIDRVKHQWVRYEYIGPDNCPDDYDNPDVSKQVVRLILSYTDYINRRTWYK